MISLLLSAAAGLLTAGVASVWAVAVAGEMGEASQATALGAPPDIRTW